MTAETPQAKPSKAPVIIGWTLGLLPGLFMLLMGVISLAMPPEQKTLDMIGWQAHHMVPLGIVMIVSVLLYLIPPTSVLGAILLTGYLGGAVATHVRIDDYKGLPMAIGFGVIFWLGLFLRDPRVRALIPIKRG